MLNILAHAVIYIAGSFALYSIARDIRALIERI